MKAHQRDLSKRYNRYRLFRELQWRDRYRVGEAFGRLMDAGVGTRCPALPQPSDYSGLGRDAPFHPRNIRRQQRKQLRSSVPHRHHSGRIPSGLELGVHVVPAAASVRRLAAGKSALLEQLPGARGALSRSICSTHILPMRFVLAFVLAASVASKALAQVPDTVGQAPLAPARTELTVNDVGRARRVWLLERADSTRKTHHAKHALTGAALGAAVGVAAGFVSLRTTDLTCNNGACTHRRNGVLFVTLTLDGAIGAGIGALLGALVP